MTFTYLYRPQTTSEAHICDLPRWYSYVAKRWIADSDVRVGSLIQCDECRQYWLCKWTQWQGHAYFKSISERKARRYIKKRASKK